jgi:hypothetical protein
MPRRLAARKNPRRRRKSPMRIKAVIKGVIRGVIREGREIREGKKARGGGRVAGSVN